MGSGRRSIFLPHYLNVMLLLLYSMWTDPCRKQVDSAWWECPSSANGQGVMMRWTLAMTLKHLTDTSTSWRLGSAQFENAASALLRKMNRKGISGRITWRSATFSALSRRSLSNVRLIDSSTRGGKVCKVEQSLLPLIYRMKTQTLQHLFSLS